MTDRRTATATPEHVDAVSVRAERRWGERGARWRVTAGLLAAPIVWLLLFFVVPVILVGSYSVGLVALLPRDSLLTFDAWRDFLSDPIFVGVFWKSVRMSLIVSVSVVILAYPVAYFLAMVATRRKYVLLLLTIAPFLTSYLLRVLAWRVILGNQGVVNSFLFWSGIRDPDDPVTWLLYSQFAVIVVLIYVWVPFVALPIFVSLDHMDRYLLEAASDLGASRWRSFWQITFPLSLPGVIAAFIFVFIPTIGEYVTPLLVGGTRGFMFGNAIADAFLVGFNWQLGSALALFLIAVVGVLVAISSRFLNVGTLTAE